MRLRDINYRMILLFLSALNLGIFAGFSWHFSKVFETFAIWIMLLLIWLELGEIRAKIE